MSAERKSDIGIDYITNMQSLPGRIGEDIDDIRIEQEVLADNNGVLVTRASQKTLAIEKIKIQMRYDLPTGLGNAIGNVIRYGLSGFDETVTVTDSRTGLPSSAITYRNRLFGKRVESVTKWDYSEYRDGEQWDYPTDADGWEELPMEENEDRTFYGIKKTTVDLDKKSPRETVEVMEIPYEGGIPTDGVQLKPPYQSVHAINRLADEIIGEMRKIPDLAHIKDPRRQTRYR